MSQTPPPTVGVSARQLREQLRAVILAYGALDSARRPCGARLSLPHAYALIELLQADGLTVSSLAQRLNIDRTNVSRLCSRMEADGALTRTPHPNDARARVLRLTPAGRRTAHAVEASSSAHFAQVLARLGPHPEAVVEALRLLADAMGSA